MINMNRKPGLKKWGQTLPVHNQQRFHSMLSLLFPFGKLAICYGSCRRYVMERRDQGLDRGPWRVAEYYIRWQLVSPSWVPLPGCIWIGHIFPESRRPHSVREADRVPGFAAACQIPTKPLLARAPGSLGFWKARNPLFKFMLAFNYHKGNLLKRLFQVEMNRKHLKWIQLFVSVLIFN